MKPFRTIKNGCTNLFVLQNLVGGFVSSGIRGIEAVRNIYWVCVILVKNSGASWQCVNPAVESFLLCLFHHPLFEDRRKDLRYHNLY